MKYAKELRQHFSKKPVFSVRDINNFFSKKKISSNYANVLLNHLLKREEIFRIARGTYSFCTNPNVVAFAIQPSYFGLQDALSLHSFWNQGTIPILITPRKIRPGLRKVVGTNVLVKRISRKMFFGIEMIKYSDFWIPVSNPEKTLIDFFYFNEPLDRQTLKKILKKINKKKFSEYLKKTPEKTRKKIKKLFL
jgi:predicted transcriptional regulator of viral defense system